MWPQDKTELAPLCPKPTAGWSVPGDRGWALPPTRTLTCFSSRAWEQSLLSAPRKQCLLHLSKQSSVHSLTQRESWWKPLAGPGLHSLLQGARWTTESPMEKAHSPEDLCSPSPVARQGLWEQPGHAFSIPRPLNFIPWGEREGKTWLWAPWVCSGHLERHWAILQKSSPSACPGQHGATIRTKKKDGNHRGKRGALGEPRPVSAQGFQTYWDFDPSFPQKTLGQVLSFTGCPPQRLLPTLFPVRWTRILCHHQPNVREPQLEPGQPGGCVWGVPLKPGHGLGRQGWHLGVVSTFWAKELPPCGSFLKFFKK